MWLYKTLTLTLYILVEFGEVRTHSSTCDTRGSTEVTTPSRTLDRSKRDVGNQQNYTVELLIAVDRMMIDYHTDKLEEYVLTLMSSASRFLLHKSIGNPIDLAVVDIIKVDLKAEECNGNKK